MRSRRQIGRADIQTNDIRVGRLKIDHSGFERGKEVGGEFCGGVIHIFLEEILLILVRFKS
jgi:hypothetical protein